MKKRVLIAGVIMIVSLFCMIVNWFIIPLSDLMVRIIGIIMIIDLVALTYSSVKLGRRNK